MNNSDVSIYFNNLLGSHVHTCKLIYGGQLRVDLCHMQNDHTQQWTIMTRLCSWRITHNGFVICGSEDEIQDSDDALADLDLGQVIKTTQNNSFDFSICTDQEFRIDYFMTSIWVPQLTIHNEDCAFELTHVGWEEINRTDIKKLYDKTLSVVDIYSEECMTRWRSIVPENIGSDSCDTCFYYRGLGGSFHYWDYGVCSNKDSEFDGKLVSVKSGCEKFAVLKELIE